MRWSVDKPLPVLLLKGTYFHRIYRPLCAHRRPLTKLMNLSLPYFGLRLVGTLGVLRSVTPFGSSRWTILKQQPQRQFSSVVTSRKSFEDALLEKESDKLYGLGTKQSDLCDIAAKLARGKLNLFPPYQRSYVWKPDKASRLIATVLCSRFVPPIVLHEKVKGEFDVVDGKQRLTSLLGFYLNREGAEPAKDPVIREKLDTILPQLKTLSKLDESYQELNGLSFDELSDERKGAFESYSITYVIIPFGTPKADVFEDSGGEDLTAQQVRRAVYHGPYTKLLDDLATKCEDFHAVRDPKAFKEGNYEPCPKDSDRELILRAFAFRANGDSFKPSLKKFLNREMTLTDNMEERNARDQSEIEQKLQEQLKEFEEVMKIARSLFEEKKGFPRKKSTGKIENSWWDAMYCVLAETLKRYKRVDLIRAKDTIQERLQTSMDEGFFSITDNVTSASKFIDRKRELREIILGAIEDKSATRDAKRAFPPDWKVLLHKDQGGKCALCDQSIDPDRLDHTGYVHIDHKLAYIYGGPTTYENAQLTHAECNLSKGAKSF